MTRAQIASLVGLTTLAASCQSNPTASPPAPLRSRTASLQNGTVLERVASLGGRITSLDGNGAPQFLWATKTRPALPGQDAEMAARAHLGWFAPALSLDRATVEQAELVRIQDLGRGSELAHLKQRIDGVEVYRSDVKVLMKRNHELVAISGALRPASLLRTAAHARFSLAPAEALGRAIGDLFGVTLSSGDFDELAIPGSGAPRFQLRRSDTLHLSEPARVTKLWVQEGARLTQTYSVELFAGLVTSVESSAWRVLVSAEDGRILERRDLTAHDAFNYRIWADDTAQHRPLDGPETDFTPHPTGKPDKNEVPTFIPPSMIAMDGFNHNPLAVGDPWLAANAVQSLGNNVDAYSDSVPPDGYSNGDLRATTTSAKTFDRTYDLTQEAVANQSQTMSGIIQAFYILNWLHDWYYDSGFDEAAGNAQANNYGRGGEGGDPIHAEMQDSYAAGSRNNANMSTPADGFSPRMQMYVWSGAETRTLTVAGNELKSGSASFGPKSFNVTGEVVLADDGTSTPPMGTPNDGCETITNVTGKIALIDRGTCGFAVKTANAQKAGAIGVIIANNTPAQAPPGMSGTDATITIPALSITQEDGAALKTQLTTGTVSTTMFRTVGPERDGALDSTVVAHEWGHYLHHRLADCGAGQCAAISEGWGDFNALMMVLRDGDKLDGAYGLATYATGGSSDAAFFGIRRFTYSVDPSLNALSLRHIGNGVELPTTTPSSVFGVNSEVHNAGEIWASMMFEVYVSLQQARGKRSFEDMHRTMSDYVVAGLQLTPPDATYTEQRDGILAAIAARDPGDLAIATAAFARRGAGTCATMPDRYSKDFVGVVESSDVKPVLALGEVRVDDSVRSCDQDGVLDADEAGHVTLTVSNAGPKVMASTLVSVSSPTTGLTFPKGTTVLIPEVPPFSSVPVMVDVALDPSVTTQELLDLTVSAGNADACVTTTSHLLVQHINVDERPGVSATDPVESVLTAWTRTGTDASTLWLQTEVSPGDHAWVGADPDALSDTQLESPDLLVSDSDKLVVTFDHKFSFEADTKKPTWFDGGVIELTSDGGATWADVATLGVTPGYGGALDTGNPLKGRQAFVGTNPSWPMRDTVTLDFGTAYASKTVRLRFRVASDAGTGDYGWEIDNIAVSGITNKPFAGLVDDQGVCSLVCPGGLAACGDTCTYLLTDVANCGACGNACAGGSVCTQGQCALSCQAGQTSCGGGCTNLQTDNAHCGDCGNACPTGSVCSAGTCALSCQAGLLDCSGRCSNLLTDDANCGSCGFSCAIGWGCVGGTCQSRPAGNRGGGGCSMADRAPAPLGGFAMLLLLGVFGLAVGLSKGSPRRRGTVSRRRRRCSPVR
jgi:hypothetical protein